MWSQTERIFKFSGHLNLCSGIKRDKSYFHEMMLTILSFCAFLYVTHLGVLKNNVWWYLQVGPSGGDQD